MTNSGMRWNERTALWLALGNLVAWYVVLTIFLPRPVMDERVHFPIIARMVERGLTLSPKVPMLPGYHLLAAVVGKVLGAGLGVARGVSLVMAGLSVLVFARTAKLIKGVA